MHESVSQHLEVRQSAWVLVLTISWVPVGWTGVALVGKVLDCFFGRPEVDLGATQRQKHDGVEGMLDSV